MVHQDAMEVGAADSVRCPARKLSLGLRAVAHETNAAKRIRNALGNGDAELTQGLDSIRHEPFAAGLVDRRDRAIRYDHAQTVAARRDGCRQTGRAAANY